MNYLGANCKGNRWRGRRILAGPPVPREHFDDGKLHTNDFQLAQDSGTGTLIKFV